MSALACLVGKLVGWLFPWLYSVPVHFLKETRPNPVRAARRKAPRQLPARENRVAAAEAPDLRVPQLQAPRALASTRALFGRGETLSPKPETCNRSALQVSWFPGLPLGSLCDRPSTRRARHGACVCEIPEKLRTTRTSTPFPCTLEKNM